MSLASFPKFPTILRLKLRVTSTNNIKKSFVNYFLHLKLQFDKKWLSNDTIFFFFRCENLLRNIDIEEKQLFQK